MIALRSTAALLAAAAAGIIAVGPAAAQQYQGTYSGTYAGPGTYVGTYSGSYTDPNYAPPPPPPPQGYYERRDADDRYRDDRYGDDRDIIVYSRPRNWRLPDDVESASQVVHYGDLDLRYAEDRRELRNRISATARQLCDRLGADDSFGSLTTSCRDDATRDAWARLGTPDETYIPEDSVLIDRR